jgi:excisionase family DNA binding protein
VKRRAQLNGHRAAAPEGASLAADMAASLRSSLERISALHSELAAAYGDLARHVGTGLAVLGEASLYGAMPAPEPKLEFLATKDVAELLRVSPRTVRRMVGEGRLPTGVQVTPGRSVWRRCDLDAWFEDEASRG